MPRPFRRGGEGLGEGLPGQVSCPKVSPRPKLQRSAWPSFLSKGLPSFPSCPKVCPHFLSKGLPSQVSCPKVCPALVSCPKVCPRFLSKGLPTFPVQRSARPSFPVQRSAQVSCPKVWPRVLSKGLATFPVQKVWPRFLSKGLPTNVSCPKVSPRFLSQGLVLGWCLAPRRAGELLKCLRAYCAATFQRGGLQDLLEGRHRGQGAKSSGRVLNLPGAVPPPWGWLHKLLGSGHQYSPS